MASLGHRFLQRRPGFRKFSQNLRSCLALKKCQFQVYSYQENLKLGQYLDIDDMTSLIKFGEVTWCTLHFMGRLVFYRLALSAFHRYSWLSLSRTRKGPENLFEIERVRDRERKIGYSLHKGTETLVRDRERFEIEGVRDRESQLYFVKTYKNWYRWLLQ